MLGGDLGYDDDPISAVEGRDISAAPFGSRER